MPFFICAVYCCLVRAIPRKSFYVRARTSTLNTPSECKKPRGTRLMQVPPGPFRTPAGGRTGLLPLESQHTGEGTVSGWQIFARPTITLGPIFLHDGPVCSWMTKKRCSHTFIRCVRHVGLLRLSANQSLISLPPDHRNASGENHSPEHLVRVPQVKPEQKCDQPGHGQHHTASHGYKVDQSALAFTENGRLKFYGTKNLVD